MRHQAHVEVIIVVEFAECCRLLDRIDAPDRALIAGQTNEPVKEPPVCNRDNRGGVLHRDRDEADQVRSGKKREDRGDQSRCACAQSEAKQIVAIKRLIAGRVDVTAGVLTKGHITR